MPDSASQTKQLEFASNAARTFDDPDDFAATIPGGSYGVLPLGKEDFKSSIRMTNLGGGVSARSVGSSNPVLIRGEFGGGSPRVSFLLPCIRGTAALLNGREVDDEYVSSSSGGVKHHLRTQGPHEIGTITFAREALLEAHDTLAGGRAPAYLNEDAVIRGNPTVVRLLNALHRQAGELLRTHSPQALNSIAAGGVGLLRDAVFAAVVEITATGSGKPDHLATRRQTASMMRIDCYIDDHPNDVFSLQDLCRETGMALRTMEAIIRSRTGLTTLGYLRHRRLAFARKALLNASSNTKVTDVALGHGFLHFGRFSAYYREAFGEAPSTTLARALGRNSGGYNS